MKQKIKIFLIVCIFSFAFDVKASEPFLQPLLQQNDLVYAGSFRVPGGKFGTISTHSNSFTTGAGRALAYNKASHSIFMVGHTLEQLVAELSIPATIVKNTNRSLLSTASVIQNPAEVTGGHGCFIGPGETTKCNGGSSMVDGNVRIGGTLFDVDANKLYGTTYAVYDGPGNATFSHFVTEGNWSTGVNSQGMYRAGLMMSDNNALSAGFVGGYMTWIPSEWQNDFGGTALTGQAAQAIVSRTSYGPSISVFSPDGFGNGVGAENNPLPIIPLLYYPSTHQTLGSYDQVESPNPAFNNVTEITGVVFPKGTRSILFFGRTGTGIPCYGAGTSNIEDAASNAEILSWLQANNPEPYPTPPYGGSNVWTNKYTCGTNLMDEEGNNWCCYDPGNSAKGVHNTSYAYYAWAYDAIDLLKVKNGAINANTGQSFKPWDIVPYAQWELTDLNDLKPPVDKGGARIYGAAYDEINGNIYISQADADYATYEHRPLIAVFHANIEQNTISPSAPVGLMVE